MDAVEVVRRAIAAYNAQDLEALLALCHPDGQVDWTRSRSPLSGHYHDQQGYTVLLTEYWHVFDEIRLVPERLIAVGEHVVVPSVSHVRGRGGIALSQKSVYVFTVRDGRIVA